MEALVIQSASLDDMIFENRNKSYGAYLLRQIYNKHLTISTIIASGLFIVFIAAPYLISLTKGVTPEKKLDLSEVTLQEAPPQDPKEPPPPPVEPPPPLKSTIQFVPPQPVEDKQVTENRVVTVDDLKDVDISTKTEVGDPNGVDRSLLDESNKGPVATDDNTVQTYVEQMPVFPGGEEALMKYLRDHINYPPMAVENEIQGKVIVDFVVGKDGKIRDIKVAKKLGFGFDEEAVRVIGSMPPWNPGKQNGRTVNVSYKVPVKFTLH
jgi:protein TonB